MSICSDCNTAHNAAGGKQCKMEKEGSEVATTSVGKLKKKGQRSVHVCTGHIRGENTRDEQMI